MRFFRSWTSRNPAPDGDRFSQFNPKVHSRPNDGAGLSWWKQIVERRENQSISEIKTRETSSFWDIKPNSLKWKDLLLRKILRENRSHKPWCILTPDEHLLRNFYKALSRNGLHICSLSRTFNDNVTQKNAVFMGFYRKYKMLKTALNPLIMTIQRYVQNLR